MSNLKFSLANSVSAVAGALFAFSFAFVDSRAYAEDHVAISSQLQTMFLDSDGPVAEWWICRSDGQVCINTHQTDLQMAVNANHSSQVTGEIEPSIPQALAPRVRN